MDRREATAPTSQSHRILVADDNEDTVDSMRTLLEMLGHEVRTATDGLQALAEAEQFRPEIVLLDIGMPGLDGYGVARRIREQPWGKDLMLVAVTGWGQEGDKERARDAGFDRHFTKPLQPADLDDLMSSLETDSKASST